MAEDTQQEVEAVHMSLAEAEEVASVPLRQLDVHQVHQDLPDNLVMLVKTV